MPFNEHKPTAQQKKISRATVRAQEQERNRIAAELHDNVSQLLVTATLHIGMARREGCCTSPSLEQAEDCLQQTIEAIKILTRRLTTSLVEHKGLLESINGIVTAMTSLQIKVHAAISAELVAKLSAEQQLMVYRIVQEQTNNILKYAQAPEACITLHQVEEMAELRIRDNGKGFDLETQQRGGIGFINIYNRATAFNGTVDIRSSTGKGCTLTVRFPVILPDK